MMGLLFTLRHFVPNLMQDKLNWVLGSRDCIISTDAAGPCSIFSGRFSILLEFRLYIFLPTIDIIITLIKILWRCSPSKARTCETTVDLISTNPKAEINYHLACSGMKCSNHIESPRFYFYTGITITNQ